MKILLVIYCAISLTKAFAQPILPEPSLSLRTNYFVVTATDDVGQTSEWSEESSSTNLPPYKISWDASPGWTDSGGVYHPITNYVLRWSSSSLSETNARKTLSVGTNLEVEWPPYKPPSNVVIRVSSALVRTNPIDGPKFFALFESSDLSHWKISSDATNRITVDP